MINREETITETNRFTDLKPEEALPAISRERGRTTMEETEPAEGYKKKTIKGSRN